jgi:hypothetical protein
MLMDNGTMSSVPNARDTASRPADPARLWQDTYTRFLVAVHPDQRETIEPLLQQLHFGSSGLRQWLDAIVWEGAVLPEQIPPAIIEVYLHDSEAMPLYECGDCGLAVPVRPNRTLGPDAEPEKVYFADCPVCGGPTGYCLFRTRHFSDKLRQSKPR